MKNFSLTILFLLSFLFSFSQSDKKYTVSEAVYDNTNVCLLNYNGTNIKIDIDFFTEKDLFFRISQNNKLYKIPFSKIDSSEQLLNILSTKNTIEFYTNGMALNQFSSQSQFALILQILAPIAIGNYNHCKSLERFANAKDSLVNSTRQMRALALLAKDKCLLFGERWPNKNAGQRWHVRGSSFLSSFFAYFFSNGKSMKKKRRMIDV